MIIVNQAIYGDKLGSYALLKTSLTDTELAKRICNVTDLLDRPSNGHLSQPVFRGFAFNDLYIFIKSFPDNDPTVRKGRVLSHTLIVEQGDLHQLNDLDTLFSHFLSQPDKDPKLNSIVINDGASYQNKIVNHTSREAAAINNLLYHSDYNNGLIWVGEENYLSFIAQVWGQLGSGVRAKLKLGVGFNPQKIDTHHLSILYVLEEYENKWQAKDYCIVGKEDRGTLETMSSLLLAGYEDKSKSLSDLVKIFGVELAEIEDFRYLETVATTYTDLSTSTDFNRLIILCDIISKYSPDKKVAKEEKSRVLKFVISRIESVSAKEILMLRNVEWSGFSNAQQFVSDQIANWIVKSMFNSKVDETNTSLIAMAFDPEEKAEWWKKAFSGGLKTVLENWKSTHSISLWSWFSEDHNLVKTLEDLIPDNTQVEIDFVDHWQKPEQELAKKIQIFSRDRKWLILHGLSTLQFHSEEESIKIQIEIDVDPKYFDALKRMSELIHDVEFIQLTVKIGESRLVKIAGEKIARMPSLLGQLDVKNIIWRQIWLTAIGDGNKYWDGIKKPLDVLFSLFEVILTGEIVESDLLLRLSTSDYNNLSAFKRRPEVWKHLNEGVKVGFINATTLGCVKLIDKKDISINDLEDDIRACLTNVDIITQVIGDKTITVSTKIQLFRELLALKENELIKLLNGVHFSTEESKCIGKLIFRKNWKKAAKVVADKISSRKDLKSALIQCQSLLSIYERLKLSVSGYLTDHISTEEWWNATLEQCYKKYPKGPADKGLWGRSDGVNYDLPTTGSGREIWEDVISKMKNGRTDVDVQKLLREMLKDHTNSDELKQLNKTYK